MTEPWKKQAYIERLKEWAASSSSESYALGLLQVAQELESMADVVWAPKPPTDYMKDEGAGALGIYPNPSDKAAHACYEAMLNAAENTNE